MTSCLREIGINLSHDFCIRFAVTLRLLVVGDLRNARWTVWVFCMVSEQEIFPYVFDCDIDVVRVDAYCRYVRSVSESV